MPSRIFVSIALSLFLGFTHHWIRIHSGQKLQSESKNNRIWCETSEQLQSILLNSFSIETHELIHSTALSRLFLVLCILKLLIRIERNFIQSGQRLTFRTFDRFWTHAARFNAFQQYFFPFIHAIVSSSTLIIYYFLILRPLFNLLCRRIGNCFHAHKL